MKFVVLAFFCLIAVTMAYSRKGQCSDENASYKCYSPCVATCQNRQFAHCQSECVEDCYCNDNYIKDEISNKCVLVKDCPRY